MSEFHDEYYKSFKIEVKLFKNSNPLVIRDVDDNIEEWVYSVKPPKELELLHGSHGFFFHTTYGDPTPTQAIANAKARIDEAISQKVGELESQLELLRSFSGDRDKNVRVGSIVEISFIDEEIEPGQKICLTVKSIKVDKNSTFIYLDTASELIKTEDDSYIILTIGNHIYCNSLSGFFDEENGPQFAGSFDIEWKVIQE